MKNIQICTIVGARPQFVKSAVISREIRKWKNVHETIIHTGQHYDKNMSEIFFKELNIPFPDFNLNIRSGNHGKQTGMMLSEIEKTLLSQQPDLVLLYGDTNSTLAGALASAKLHIPIAHIEAGLRSFNRFMPEEINRICTDRVSNYLFAPTRNAKLQLYKEGFNQNTFFSGDVMFDSVLFYKAQIESDIDNYLIDNLPKEFYLATVHRPSNTNNKNDFNRIISALNELDKKVILPVHPRIKNQVSKSYKNLILCEPVSYKTMLALILKSSKVITDSGGLQKEAFFLKTPCVTLRDETEWIETLESNWNILAGNSKKKIIESINKEIETKKQKKYFGNGKAGKIIIEKIIEEFK